MARAKVPSIVQAKKLAELFSSGDALPINGPTAIALIRAEWVDSVGKITSAGLEALERYLWNIRVNAATSRLSSHQLGTEK